MNFKMKLAVRDWQVIVTLGLLVCAAQPTAAGFVFKTDESTREGFEFDGQERVKAALVSRNGIRDSFGLKPCDRKDSENADARRILCLDRLKGNKVTLSKHARDGSSSKYRRTAAPID